jgi:lipid-A-disaccharide synthase
VRATYVGNPLVDRLLTPAAALPAGPAEAALAPPREAALAAPPGAPASAARPPLDAPARLALRQALGLDPARPVLALLPGSRRQELRRLWRPLLEAGRILLAEYPGLQLVVPVAPSVDRAPLEAEAAALGLTPTFLAGRAAELLSCADAAAVASGTATLEAALEGAPLVVVYRTSWLTWLVGRLLVRVQFVSLVNLLAGRALVTELLQSACTPARIAAALRPLLDGGPQRQDQLHGFDDLRALLAPPGQPHAARRAAQELLSVLDEAP